MLDQSKLPGEVHYDDVADVDFVLTQVCRVLPQLPEDCVVLVSSQMPVGSVAQLERYASEKLAQRRLRFACTPENLRLGSALKVFLHPDRVVVGVRDAQSRTVLESLWHPVTANIEWMAVESAEMTKHAINAFLATSVTFAN